MSWISRLFASGDVSIRTLEGRDAVTDTLDVFSLPMVVACRQLYADIAASISLISVDRNGNPKARVPLILESPSAWEPLGDFLERMVNDMTRHGRAWMEVTARDGFDNPLAVDLVSDRRVVVTLTQDGQHIGRVQIDGRDVDRRDVIQVPMLLDDGPLGESPIIKAEPNLRYLLGALPFAGTMFDSGATPNYVIKSQTRLPPETAEALMRSWFEARANRRPALLSGDLDLETFSGSTAAEVQLQKMLDTIDATVARVFQVPPSIVNAVANSSLTYSTANAEVRRLLISLNVSVLNRIESAMTELLPANQFAKFDTADLTRLDETETLTNTITAYQAGLITEAEARIEIGRDPDTLTQTPELTA